MISIGIAFALTALLTYITDRDESPYFILLAIPILQCAYVFGLLTTILTIAAADGLIFTWLSYFFALHPPVRLSQYLEGGMLSVIYLQIGLLVWFLVNRLKGKHIGEGMVYRQWARARQVAGLPRELVLYCARHDFGSFVLAKTGNLKAVMNAMGHGDVRSAMIYQHPEGEIIRNALNARHISRPTEPDDNEVTA